MNKKEVASYMLIDSAIFIKKAIKKSSYFSMKYLGIMTVVALLTGVSDNLIHKDIYEKNKISGLDLIINNNQFAIEKPINSFSHLIDEEDKILLPKLRHSYIPLVAEFNPPQINYTLSNEEYSSLKESLAIQYEQICNTGIISKLVCLKYDKYREIENLKR